MRARLARVLAAFVAALILGELAVRIFRPLPPRLEPPAGLYVPDPLLRRRHVPGFDGRWAFREFDIGVKINSLGFRDVEHAPGPGTLPRIAFLGDSFTFGFGVEAAERFSDRCGDLLHRKGVEAEVLNFGVAGYGDLSQLEILKSGRLLETFRPRLVVLAWFTGNDLYDDLDFGRPQARPAPSGLKGFLGRHSRLYGFTMTTLSHRSRPLPEDLPRPLSMYLCKSTAEVQAGWKLVAESLTELDARVRAQGARLIVMPVPDPFVVHRGLWDREVDYLKLDRGDFDLDLPTRHISELCAARGIPTVSLLPALRASAARGEKLYFDVNAHWMPLGHQRAAEALSEGLYPLLPP